MITYVERRVIRLARGIDFRATALKYLTLGKCKVIFWKRPIYVHFTNFWLVENRGLAKWILSNN